MAITLANFNINTFPFEYLSSENDKLLSAWQPCKYQSIHSAHMCLVSLYRPGPLTEHLEFIYSYVISV